MSEYEKQAEDFLKKTQTTFKVKFIKNGLYFPDDKEPRDIYRITLVCRGKKYSFRFGTSINDTEQKKEPTPYDVLASLTKYNPDTFEDFCSSYGYDEDSRKAEKTFKAVVKEWENISDLWTGEEINKLQEIQ